MSVAYVVTSYRYPEQVLRLARTLRAGSPDAPLTEHVETEDRKPRPAPP